jgi:opacity protein-like surface antigen
MKKVLLFAAFAAFAMTSVNAQDEDSSGFAKSDIYMSGTVGFNSSTTSYSTSGIDDDDTSSTTFSPAVGYMLTDNIALEAGLGYSTVDEDSAETTVTTFSVGARWFMNPTDKFSFSVGAGLGFGSGTRTYDANAGLPSGYEDERSLLTFTVAPAVNYWISDSFGLIANIAAFQYSSVEDSNNETSASSDTTSTGLNVDLSNINFGMVYKF